MSLAVWLRRPDLRRGALVDDYVQLKMVPTYNGTGTFVLDLQWSTNASQKAIEDGWGITVERDNMPLFSGTFTRKKRSWKGRSTNRVQLSGVDDNVHLSRRVVLPCARAGTSGTIYPTAEYDAATAVAETLMRGYVSRELITGNERQIVGLSHSTSTGLGSSVSEQGRFDNLADIVEGIAQKGGGLGYRIVQVGTALQFQVFQPVDRSSSVVFSPEFGNLIGYDYEESAPTANYIIVGGGGEGTSRVFVEGGDNDSIAKWGRIEKFVDRRDTTDLTVLRQTLADELIKNAETRKLSIAPLETVPNEFVGDFRGYLLGVDYNLGDQIRVDVDGQPLIDVVRSAEITADSDHRLSAQPMTGSANSYVGPALFATQRQSTRRLSKLETR